MKPIRNAGWYSPNSTGFYQPHRLKAFTGGAAGPAFSPSDICTGWYPADAEIFDGSNRIDTWTDSQLVADAVQGTAGNKPLYVASALNSYGILRGDTTDFMEFGSGTSFTAGTTFSCFFVVKITTQGGTWYSTISTFKGADANRNFSIVASNDASFGNIWFAYAGANGSPVAVVAAASADITSGYKLLTITYNGGTVTNTSAYTVDVNDVAQTLTNPGGTAQHTGNRNYLATWPVVPPAFALNGDVAEWGYKVGTQWDATTKTSLYTYCTGKFGI